MIFYNPVFKLANILDGLLLALRLISQLMSLHISAQIKPSAGAHTQKTLRHERISTFIVSKLSN
jgi:hypothetical protein